MAKQDAKGKVVSFRAAHKAAFGDSRKGQEDRHQPEQQKTTSPRTGGYAEVWLKANTDKDALIKENLALKKHQHELEEQQQDIIPTLPENVLYYASILFGLVVAISWLMGSLLLGGAH